MLGLEVQISKEIYIVKTLIFPYLKIIHGSITFQHKFVKRCIIVTCS